MQQYHKIKSFFALILLGINQVVCKWMFATELYVAFFKVDPDSDYWEELEKKSEVKESCKGRNKTKTK